jgi:alkaline phosphatase D
VNDLGYQERPLGKTTLVKSFEITTGSVAFDAPFGPTVTDLGYRLSIFDDEQVSAYVHGTAEEQEAFMQYVVNLQAETLGYPLVGLASADEQQVEAELLKGGWTATNTFGWTEFNIDAETQELHVTTYGITPYSREDIFADPDGILARVPEVVQEFTVKAVR